MGFKSINSLTKKATPSGLEKLPVSANEYLETQQISDISLIKSRPELYDWSIIEKVFDLKDIFYEAANKCYSYRHPDGGIIQIGQQLDLNYTNVDTIELTEKMLVSLVPLSGNRKGIKRLDIASKESVENYVGMVTAMSIPINQEGRVTIIGEVDANTAGEAENAIIYGSLTPGMYSLTPPAKGYYKVHVGSISVSANNGKILIKPYILPMLDDLSNVSNNASDGQPLVKQNNGTWAGDSDINIETVTPASGTLTVNGDLSADDVKADTMHTGTLDATGKISGNNIESANGFVKTGHTDSDILLAGGGHVSISDLKSGIYKLFNPTNNAQVVLEVNAAGEVLVHGPIVQTGTGHQVDFEKVTTKEQIVELRHEATTGMAIGDLAGFIIKLYDGVNDGMIVIDNAGVLRIGDTGDLQPVLTREEIPVDNAPLYFSSTNKRSETVKSTDTKIAIVDNDAVLIKDSEDNNKPKWWSISSIKNTLAFYFDTFYLRLADVSQTVLGVITFSKSPIVPNPTTSGQALNKGTADSSYVGLTGNQAIAGIKTFTSPPVVPSPVNNTDAANKAYVQSIITVGNDTYQENKLITDARVATLENTINSANINQETTATVTGVDTVSLPKTAANTGMQVQMFGQSAQNLVVNGDFRNGTTGILSLYSTISASGGILSVTGTGTNLNARFGASITPQITGNKLYFKSRLRVTNSVCTGILASIRSAMGDNIASNNLSVGTPTANEWYNYTGIHTVNANYATSVIEVGHQYADAATASGKIMEVDYFTCINLTATFGAGNEPTKEQCDLLFANYFEGSDNVIGTGRVRSVGKNLIDESGLKISHQGFYYQSNGAVAGSAGWRCYDFIKFPFNFQFLTNLTTSAIAFVLFYDKNKNLIGSVSNQTSKEGVTAPLGTYYIKISTAQTSPIQLERGSIATTYEPYKESSLYLTTPELRSNGLIKDEIRKGTNGYELVKRVGVGTLGVNGITGGDFEGGLIGTKTDSDGGTSTWTLNSTAPISGTQDGRLVMTIANTSGVGSRPFLGFQSTRTVGQLRKLSFSYKVNSGVCKLYGFNDGLNVIITNTTFSGAGVFTYYYVVLGTNPEVLYFDGRNLFDLQIDNIKDELVNTTDGAATGNTVTVFGSNIYYTLATPTITPISHAGSLNSNSNGTVYFEPIIADAGVYSSNLAIQLTDYPIASFESIRKYANGTYTELNTATAVIASGGLSFTHPDLVSGDLVMFTYAYANESIGRSMTLTYAISNSNPYYNVTNSVPLTTGYYTSTTARAAVPEGIRKTGLILTYETASGVWYTERYIGTATDTTSWTTAGNWEIGVLRITSVTDTTEYAEITI